MTDPDTDAVRIQALVAEVRRQNKVPDGTRWVCRATGVTTPRPTPNPPPREDR